MSTDNTDAEPTANSLSPTSDSGMRMAIASMLGESGYDDREIYETFDWPADPSDELFYSIYRRNPFAAPVVDRPPFTTWRDPPEIVDAGSDDADDDTEFETALERADRELDLWSYAERIDRLAGIGRFGVVVFVTDDIDGPDALAEPLEDGAITNGLDDVSQIKVFSEVSVDAIEWGGIEQADDGRWGLPVEYSIDFSSEAYQDDDGESDEHVYDVHHSRTVAVPASRLLDDDFFGTPRLEGVLNPLRDIEKVLGSVAELAYRGADKGIAINFDPEAVDTSEQSFDDMEAELQDWYHDIQPWIRTTGADTIEQLGGEIADPSGVIGENLSAIAAHTGIPKRVFEGDPAGALSAAEEDTQAYFGMIQERRESYATPHIARKLVDWLVEHGAVSEPTAEDNRYAVEWEPLRVLSEGEQATLELDRAKAWKNFTGGLPFEFGQQVAIDYLRDGTLPEDVDELTANAAEEGDPGVQEWFEDRFEGEQRAMPDGGGDGG